MVCDLSMCDKKSNFFSDSNDINKAQYNSMVFTNRKHHLKRSSWADFLIERSLIESVTVRFGISM